ncbi:MAG: RadC family protein [Clostridia bacterium]|nr:RadC family protein [Clostridia bacterium]
MNPHKDHRSRVKARFMAEGLGGFEEHNALELLLFYAIPQKDTNELAHALLARFGNLAGVLDADPAVLMEVDGIGEHAATLLKLIPQLAGRYYAECEVEEGSAMTADALGRMFVAKFLGETNEVVYLTMLDNSMRIIDTIKVFNGSVNSAHISPRMLAEPCILRKAAIAVIAHNHPNGVAVPSSEDMTTTTNIDLALKSLGIPLLEHYIIASGKYLPLMYKMNGLIRQNAQTSEFYAGMDTSKFYFDLNKPKTPNYEG